MIDNPAGIYMECKVAEVQVAETFKYVAALVASMKVPGDITRLDGLHPPFCGGGGNKIKIVEDAPFD